jgi:hypothetical protein
MNSLTAEIVIAVVLLGAMVVALDLGFRAGRRAGLEERAGAGNQVGAIQGAVLGLLALLLAFSFSSAMSRFLERQDLIAQEANAIGTSWLRAELLEEPARSELRSALEAYTAHRMEASERLGQGWDPEILAEVDRLHARIWSAASGGVRKRPDLALAILDPVNEVLDVHALRVAAVWKHLPGVVLFLLAACSLLSVGAIGYGCGMDRRRRWRLCLSLAILVSAALWITVDLDHPRQGLLQLDDAPLRALKFERR